MTPDGIRTKHLFRSAMANPLIQFRDAFVKRYAFDCFRHLFIQAIMCSALIHWMWHGCSIDVAWMSEGKCWEIS